MSVSTENFIKSIYKSEYSATLDSKPGTIARELGITNAATTDMARKLADRKLIDYRKYKEIKLTPEGKRMASGIIRKHRLWETFLHKVFNMSLHEIHREAELLEHQTSDFLADKLSAFLDHPRCDPHGDPIPNINGEFTLDKDHLPLSKSKAGNYYKITRLSSSEKEFFDFCTANNIDIDGTLKVESQYEKAGMTEISINNKRLLLNAEMANIIFVKQY